MSVWRSVFLSYVRRNSFMMLTRGPTVVLAIVIPVKTTMIAIPHSVRTLPSRTYYVSFLASAGAQNTMAETQGICVITVPTSILAHTLCENFLGAVLGGTSGSCREVHTM